MCCHVALTVSLTPYSADSLVCYLVFNTALFETKRQAGLLLNLHCDVRTQTVIVLVKLDVQSCGEICVKHAVKVSAHIGTVCACVCVYMTYIHINIFIHFL